MEKLFSEENRMPVEKRRGSAKARHRATPGGRQSVVYKLKKHSPALCGLCGSKLHAVPRRAPPELTKLAKTERRPQRLFGGILCSRCSERILKEAVRLKYNAVKREEVPVTHLKYVAMLEKTSRSW